MMFPEHPSQWDLIDGELGYPKFITINLKSWKGHLNTNYKFQLIRNYLDQRFCPVVHLTYFLALADIQNGPLFLAISSNGKEVNEGKKFSYASLNTMYSRIFKECQVVGGQPYTIRKSAVKWAARCGAREFEIMWSLTLRDVGTSNGVRKKSFWLGSNAMS